METGSDAPSSVLNEAGAAAVLALLTVLILWFATDARWFNLYAVAAAVLLAMPGLHLALRRGLASRGRARLLAWLVTLPAAGAALVQIGFWTAFFSLPHMAVKLGVGRSMLMERAAPYAVWVLAAYGLVCIFVVIRACGSRRAAA
jgi:hypothetical protein